MDQTTVVVAVTTCVVGVVVAVWVYRRRRNDDHHANRYPLHHFGIENRDQLYQQLCSPPFTLATKILSNNVDDSAIYDLVLKVLGEQQSLLLAGHLVRDEVSKNVNEVVLFRGNSPCTKLFSSFAKMYGLGYQQELLGPVLRHIISEDDLEVFPDRLSPSANIDANRERVTACFKELVLSITASLDEVPVPIRLACRLLYDETKEKFPNLAHTYVASFFFLRFITPAIIVPDRLGTVNVNMQRSLLIISKILQTLANDVLFGVKEPAMIYFNPVLYNLKPQFSNFLLALCREEPPKVAAERANLKESNLILLEKALSKLRK